MKTNRAHKLARWLLPTAALFALACALFAPAEARRAAQIRERPPRDPEAITSNVRGRVLYDDTERPARRARIMLVAEGGARTEHYTTTDARGEFRIANVRAGSYYAFVDVPGVLSPVAFISLGDLRTGNGPGMPDLGEGRDLFELIEVKGKEDVVVTVRARRGASLSGRVTYADGDPAVNVTINLMRRDAAGRLQKFLTGINMVSMSGLRTDDRGMYRLSGLPPGEYVIGVNEPVSHTPESERQRPDHMPELIEALAGQQFLMTFHPSTTSVKEAATVKVAAGEERTDVDVRILERELRTVAGVVLSRRERRPLKGARVAILRRDDPVGMPGTTDLHDPFESTRNGTTTDEEGRWQFTEIPDGPYTIVVKPADEYEPGGGPPGVSMNSVMVNGNRVVSAENSNAGAYRPPRRKRGHAPARRNVEIAGDVSDVTFELSDGGRVSGVLTSEGGAGMTYASVSLVRVAEGSAGATQEARSADIMEGRFSVEGLPAGRYFIQPSTYGEERKFYVKSVTWNGKDLTREPLVLGEGATAEGVQIVFARGPAELRVKAVSAGDRRPVLYALVTLLPAGGNDAPAAPPQAARTHTCWTDEYGACTLTAAPGEYRVVARSRRSLREGNEAEVMRRAVAAPLVSLRAGETKELETVVPDR